MAGFVSSFVSSRSLMAAASVRETTVGCWSIMRFVLRDLRAMGGPAVRASRRRRPSYARQRVSTSTRAETLVPVAPLDFGRCCAARSPRSCSSCSCSRSSSPTPRPGPRARCWTATPSPTTVERTLETPALEQAVAVGDRPRHRARPRAAGAGGPRRRGRVAGAAVGERPGRRRGRADRPDRAGVRTRRGSRTSATTSSAGSTT